MKLLPGRYKFNRRTWQGWQEKIVMCGLASLLFQSHIAHLKAEAQYFQHMHSRDDEHG